MEHQCIPNLHNKLAKVEVEVKKGEMPYQENMFVLVQKKMGTFFAPVAVNEFYNSHHGHVRPLQLNGITMDPPPTAQQSPL